MPKMLLALFVACLLACGTFAQETPQQPEPLGVGDHPRQLTIGSQERTYLVHIPKGYDSQKPTPVVLALHGTAMTGPMMVWYSGLNKTSDKAGFIVVYPSSLGIGGLSYWNAGGLRGMLANGQPDDVAFIRKLLDDLGTVVNVDQQRVFACGMSNGGMMCYRLAAELSDRIAAIAPVAGTVCLDESKPLRPVPVIHFHGTKDKIVPFEVKEGKSQPFMKFLGVEDSIQTWVKLNGCKESATPVLLTKDADEMRTTRKTYGGGKNESEVVLIAIEDGGHTWPGQKSPVFFTGKSTLNISANDLMWEFFEKHPLK